MTINLDIAAALAAVMWPLVLLIILLAYRKKIPELVEKLAGRVTKLEFGGVSLDLAVANPFIPDWSGKVDLRRKAIAAQINDSDVGTFRSQLIGPGIADYAEVNLDAGNEWWTSRLYIMSIIFAQTKEVEGFIFLETSGNVRRRYIGWAEPAKVRWALARRYPWLERAYAKAYSAILSNETNRVTSNRGRLGTQFLANDPNSSIQLLKEFLTDIQLSVIPPQLPPSSSEWVFLDDETSTTYERAQWLTSELLEDILGNDFQPTAVRSSELRLKSVHEQLKIFLAISSRFVAVTADDQRFEYLVDRDVLVKQVANKVGSEF